MFKAVLELVALLPQPPQEHQTCLPKSILLYVFEAGFYYVALAGLELDDLELTEIYLPQFPWCWD